LTSSSLPQNTESRKTLRKYKIKSKKYKKQRFHHRARTQLKQQRNGRVVIVALSCQFSCVPCAFPFIVCCFYRRVRSRVLSFSSQCVCVCVFRPPKISLSLSLRSICLLLTPRKKITNKKHKN